MGGIKEENMALKIKKLEAREAVYDLTVSENHNFFANGVLVHNCSEIILATDGDRTAVCCLSSTNLEYYDDWKHDKMFLKDVAEMLDNVLQYFIDHAPESIARAKFSAMRERSIGIGALGWHALLQKKNIPWESAIATALNKSIFSKIRSQLDEANRVLGLERGEAPDAAGTIEFEDESSNIVSVNSSDTISIMRDGQEMFVRAHAVIEGDILVNM
jgi:ribonucleotide reductase alpha subunit